MFGRYRDNQTVWAYTHGAWARGIVDRPADFDHHEYIVRIGDNPKDIRRIAKSHIKRYS